MNISNIKFELGNLQLPIYGFKSPDHHIMVFTPALKNLVTRHALFAKVSAGYTAGSQSGDTVGDTVDFLADTAKEKITSPEGIIDGAINFYANIPSIFKLSTIVLPRLHYLRAYMFLGVQPQRYKGFTYLTDPKINSGEDDFMRYIINPYDYIIYGSIVHSCCDGVVAEVRDGVHDKLREDYLNFGSRDVEEHLGNMIRINHGVVQLTYGGLMERSIRVKEGDTVSKGDEIAKVGCSAYSKIPFLYLGISYIGPKIPVAGNLGVAFRNEAIFWDEHFQCPLLNQLRNGIKAYDSKGDVFANVDPRHIKYTLINATRIPELALVRRFPPGFPVYR